ncbi:MAG: pyruvate kinase [Oscillospiraceae bacterium]
MLKQTFLSEQDKRDLLFGIENDVDFVAASFVSRKQDLADLNGFLRANGGEDIAVIAKIENQPGIDNIEDIFTECTGIMIARGDMGVEVPYEELPSIQKELIGKMPPARQARHHRDRDAREHDAQHPPHPRRDRRRGQRRL